jgi:hypothetical protein
MSCIAVLPYYSRTIAGSWRFGKAFNAVRARENLILVVPALISGLPEIRF